MQLIIRTTDLTQAKNRIPDLEAWLEDDDLYRLRIRKNQLTKQADRDNVKELAKKHGRIVREYKDYKNQECYEFIQEDN